MTAQVLAPITILDAMITASAIAEPDTTSGEAIWVAATSYTIGQKVIRTGTHRVYTALAAGVDAGLPEATPLRWFDTGPTNKWAAFDIYKSTAIKCTSGNLTMTLKPGIITGMYLGGLVGDSLRMVCKNSTSLAVYSDVTYPLSTYLTGDLMWEFYFGTPRQQDNLRITGLYPQDAQVELTLTPSTTAGYAAIGIWALGSWSPLGSPLNGFKAQPQDFTRFTVDAYGTVSITKGLTAKSLVGTCVMQSLAEAQAVADTVYQLLGTPCAWAIASSTSYDYLSAFGLGSADITPAGPSHATLDLTVKGFV